MAKVSRSVLWGGLGVVLALILSVAAFAISGGSLADPVASVSAPMSATLTPSGPGKPVAGYTGSLPPSPHPSHSGSQDAHSGSGTGGGQGGGTASTSTGTSTATSPGSISTGTRNPSSSPSHDGDHDGHDSDGRDD
jgi:hypothetical protein